MISCLIQQFTELCLRYQDEPMPGMFNRYMHLLTNEQIQMLTPYFATMLRTAEAARNASAEIKKLITNE